MVAKGKSLSKGRIYYSFIVMYLLFMADFMCRVGVNSLFPIIQKDLHLTDGQIGTLGSIVLVGMAVCVLPVSYLADKFSRKKAVVVLSTIWGSGTIVSALADSYSTLVISRLLVGFGNSAYAAISVAILSGWFSEEKRGKAISLYDTAMDLGFAVASSLCGIMAGFMGWRASLIFVGSCSLVLSVMSLFIKEGNQVESAQNEEKKKVDVGSALRALLKNKPLLLFSGGAAFNNLMYAATFGWMSMFMVREMNYSLALAGSVAGAISLLGIVGYPIGGVIIDKWYKKDIRSRAWLYSICNVVYGLCNILAIYLHFIPLLFIGYFIQTMSVAAPHIATQELVEERFRAVSYGVYVVFIQALGAVGPLLVGVLSENYGLTIALVVVEFAGFITAGLSLWAARYYKEVYNAVKKEEQC